jgi:NADH-quinone oxidoreductase subunit N
MPADFVAPAAVEYLRVLPEMVLTAAGALIMVLEPLTSERAKRLLGRLALAGMAAALAAAVYGHWIQGPAFSGALVIDGFAVFFRALVIVAGMLVALASFDYLRSEGLESGEYYALLVWSVAGQCIMVSGTELIVIFIGLEISSISSYVLAGYLRRRRLANEAALKYFLLGSFATAFLLYGIALIYGATGSTNLLAIRRVLSSQPPAPALLVATAAALMLVGLAFKISAAPFQMWAPDVYQGAPAPVSAFLSAGPKAAAFAILLRIFLTALLPVSYRWEPILWVVALASMLVGNFAALVQTNVKRLLAYSSIAHAGYVLVAVTAHTSLATAAAMFYLGAYVFMNVGAFTVVAYFSRQGEQFVKVADYAGLGWRKPVLASLFTIFLLSLIGVPLTGGFFGKFYVFTAALDANLVWLAVLGLLNSAVAAYYYLRLLVAMWMQEPTETTKDLAAVPAATQVALWASAAATFLLGVFPTAILGYAIRYSQLAK